MAFPETPRTLYEINPLDEVTCQLKFLPILRIDAEPPAAFQDAIRESLPVYRTGASVNISIKVPGGAPTARLPDIGAGLFGGKALKHIFESTDKVWRVSLSRDVLALTCRRYDRWEHFRSRLTFLLDALTAIYRPSPFSHVCLRYRDVVRPQQLDIPREVSWAELLQPWIVGPYAQPEITGDVQSVQTRTVIRLPNQTGLLDASYGLADEQPGPEHVFLIDSHLYKDGSTESAHVIAALNALNRQAGLFFRWCITDRLHRALRPRTP